MAAHRIARGFAVGLCSGGKTDRHGIDFLVQQGASRRAAGVAFPDPQGRIWIKIGTGP